MGHLSEFYQQPRPGLSFEFFPPKTPAGMRNLFNTVQQLDAYCPDYFTCTYGAGGSTRNATLDIVTEIKQRTGRPVASHLTCVGATREDLRDYLQQAAEREVDYIVALRGDPPKGESEFVATEGGLRYANELVALIRDAQPGFGVAVAGYPEVHQEAVDAISDMANLKRKVDAGADIVITQLFYQNEDFYRFLDDALAAGIDVPIIPGLLPITNLAQIQRITSLCKARLPDSLVNRLAENESTEWQFEVGVEFASEQVRDLLENGAVGTHFYVLNKSQATARVLDNCWPCRA